MALERFEQLDVWQAAQKLVLDGGLIKSLRAERLERPTFHLLPATYLRG